MQYWIKSVREAAASLPCCEVASVRWSDEEFGEKYFWRCEIRLDGENWKPLYGESVDGLIAAIKHARATKLRVHEWKL